MNSVSVLQTPSNMNMTVKKTASPLNRPVSARSNAQASAEPNKAAAKDVHRAKVKTAAVRPQAGVQASKATSQATSQAAAKTAANPRSQRPKTPHQTAQLDPQQQALKELLGILRQPYEDACNVCKGEGMITEKSTCPKCKGTGSRYLRLL